ncbi:MAG: hypothetical protein J7527_09905 [Chitinophagaceae bacterium]|nr:hypothetical protein [Chitinophagaceae bacterium]
MIFNRTDLEFIHYHWANDTTPVNEIYSGDPARRSFDPFNGDQVLFLINYYAATVGGMTVQQAHIIEHSIAHKLPLDLKSERSVYAWLKENSTTSPQND